MPHIPGMKWGAVTNLSPKIQNLKMLNRMLKHDSKWHMVIDTPNSTIVDSVPIVKKKVESMT
jgi:hypothetical protein